MKIDIQKNFFDIYQEMGFFQLVTNTKISPWIALCCGLILLTIPEIFLNLSPGVAVWSTFIILVVLSLTAWHQARSMGENPWISPLFLHLAIILTFQTASGLLLIWHWELATATTGWDPGGFIYLLESLPKASGLILLGALGAYIGLLFPVRFLTGWLPALRWTVDERRFSLRAGIFIPIIIISFYLTVKEGILPASLQHLVLVLGQCGIILFIVGILKILNRTEYAKWWKIIVIVWGISYMPLAMFGSRSAILFPLVFLIWTYLAVKKRLSRKLLVVSMTFFFVFVVVLFPWLTSYKDARTGLEQLPIGEAASIATEVISVKDEIPIIALVFEVLRTQTFPGTFVANYIQHYPDSIPYRIGESFFIVMSEMIPRFINPDKPSVGLYINKLSYDIGMGHEGALWESRQFIDAISEFYINFGPVGVFLLSILQGIYLQARYDWLIRRSNFSLGFPIYAAGFISSSAFWHILVSDSRNFIVWILFLWLASHRNGLGSKALK